MDKRQARLRIHDLLDVCQACEKKPMYDNGRSSVKDRESDCGACATYKELARLRPILDGEGVKEAVTLTVEDFVQLNYVEKKSYSEIAEMTGVERKAIGNWKWRNKEAIQKVLAEKGLTEADAKTERGRVAKSNTALSSAPVKTSDSDAIDWKAKHKEAMETVEMQEQEIKELVLRIDALNKELIHANSEQLHAACEDVEKELASIREENSRLLEKQYQNSYAIENQKDRINQLTLNNSKLEYENKLLSDLLKVKL